MKITKIMTASAVALTLAFGTVISASAADFDKDSIEVQNGIVLRPGDTINTVGTSEKLYFADPAYCEWYMEDSGDWTVGAGNTWGYVKGFYFNEDGKFIIEDLWTQARFIPEDGHAFKITYTTDGSQYDANIDGDWWVLTQEEISLVDLDDCYIEVDEIEKTVTVKIGDADGQIVSPDNYTVEYVGIDNDYSGTEFPTEPGKYGVVVTAAETSLVVTGVNDSIEFTIEEEESSVESSESTPESEPESQDESTPEVIDSQDESTVDESSKVDSSKADTSSKATSTASTTNPGTGAAAAMGILAVAAAGIAVSKKKSK